MRFHIENDLGSVIAGWVVPDNPLAIPRVAVSLEGRRVAEVPATVVLADIKSWGWHSTGQCAFQIDEVVLPGLTGADRLEIHDVDTNVLLHRRPLVGTPLQARVAIVESGIEATTAIQSALFPHFQMCYFEAGRLSEETLASILNGTTTSILVAGALRLPRYEDALYRNGFTMSILVRDAYSELARRILWLRGRGELAASPEDAWRIAMLRAPVAFAASLSLEDPVALRKAFRSLDQETWNFLSSPLTRTLACSLPDERLEPFHPSQALEALSRFHVVGHEAFWDAYVATVFGKVGVETARPEAPATRPEVESLAESLRRVAPAQTLVQYDAVLSDAVRGIVAQQWGGA